MDDDTHLSMDDTTEQENAYTPEMEVSNDQTEEVVESAKEVEKRDEEDCQEVQVFRSEDEAYEYVKNYEIATNNKFVKRKNKVGTTDIGSLYKHRIYYNYKLCLGHHNVTINDGIPTVRLGTEDRECQYGPDYKSYKLKREERPDRKRRMAVLSKKLGCTAQVRIRKVLKFPEYFIEEGRRTKHIISAMITRLREEFSEETKRYLLVYVHIDTNHNHEPCPVIRPAKYLGINRKVSQGCNRRVDDFNEYVEKGLVLKRHATLKGRDLSYLALQFKDAQEMPQLIARPKRRQILQDMDIHELMALYHEITGQVPNEMFALASKQFTKENLVLLLHLCIMFANAAIDRQTHRSVRLKGTECDFTPVECYEDSCGLMESHMHCPLCSKADSYTDVALLKAHYTKQHINKALEFSGMRILRCFDTCQIDSKYVQNKTFKAGHWHCFACTNAIGSRYDTLLHFKRHLNAFGSSFQVHIAQDVNPSSSYNTTTYEIQNNLNGIEMHMSETNDTPHFHALDLPVTTIGNNLSPSKYVGGVSPTKRPYTDAGLGGHDNSVVYVEEDELGNVVSTYTAQEIPTAGQENVVISYSEAPDAGQQKTKIWELEMKNKKLDRQNVLQKSYIDFLEKTISDQKEEFSAEKEKLEAEIRELRKKEKGLDDDTTETHATEGNNIPQESSASKAGPRKCISKKVPTVAEMLDKDKEAESVANELSNLKKEMERLRSSFYLSTATAPNLATNPVLPNASSLYFIPNQNMMTPYIFPQNMTGLANTNITTAQSIPISLSQNTTALNLLNTRQTVSDTVPVVSYKPSVAVPDTQTTDTNSNKQLALAVEVHEARNQGQSDVDSSGNNDVDDTENPGTSNTAVPDESENVHEQELSLESPEVSMDTSCFQGDADEDSDSSKLASKGEVDETLLTDPLQKEDGTCVDTSDIVMQDAAESEINSEDECESPVNYSEETASDKCNISPGTSSLSNKGLSNKASEDEEIYHATPLRSYKPSVLKNFVTYTVKLDSKEKHSPPAEKNTVAISTSSLGSSSTVTCTSSTAGTVSASSTTTSTTSNLTSGNINIPFMIPPNVGMQNTTPKPVMMISNQHSMNQIMVTPNVQGMYNPMGLTSNLAMNIKLASNLQSQNDQYVVVNSPSGAFLIPKSRITGLDKIPGMNTSVTTSQAQTSQQAKDSTAKVDSTKTTNTVNTKTKNASVINTKGSTESVANRKSGTDGPNTVGKSRIVFVEHEKKTEKGDQMQSPSKDENTVNINKSKGVNVGTSTPNEESLNTKSATERIHEKSLESADKTNKTGTAIKDIVGNKRVISIQTISNNEESDTEAAVPAKKKNMVLVKVNKDVDKTALAEFLTKHKVFLKKKS